MTGTGEIRGAADLDTRLLEAAPDAMLIVAADGRITSVNEQAERLFGYPRSELLGKPIEILVPEQRQAMHVHARSAYHRSPRTRAMGSGIQLFGRRKDGSEFPADISLSPLRTDQGTIVTAAVRDVTDHVALEEDLRRAKLAADQANQAKSEYLSRMSHELRTPLNAILGFAQLLEMDEPRQDQRDSLRHILSGAEHLLGLVNDVLDIAAIEAGRLSLSLEPIAIDEALAEAVSLIRPLAGERRIQLMDPPGASAEHVVGDRQRVKQVLLNLLSNAIKYNREGGRVELGRQQLAGGWLRISVTDTGPGIPSEVLDRLFVPFERLGSERGSVEGTGLGLALSKRLADAMGGTLGVSTTLGQGSTFWVDLRRTGDPAARVEQPEPPPEQQRPHPEVPLTVLCIEDNVSNLQLLQGVLRRRPAVTLISAMRPQLGLELTAEHHPDLILLDLHLPDMPGEEVLRRLRAEPGSADIPVVILSADARPGVTTQLLEAGAQAFLTKPLRVKEVLDLIDGLAAERQHAGRPAAR